MNTYLQEYPDKDDKTLLPKFNSNQEFKEQGG
jgi:hypothetical protein